MQAFSARKLLITLTHTVHTLRAMNQKSLLAAVFVSTLAFTSIACDDDTNPTRDAGIDRTPDLAVTEGGVDRTIDTSTEVAADKAPDTTMTDAGADKAPDSMVDAPADMAVDRTPDQAVDLPPDTTPDVMADAVGDVNPTVVNLCTVFEDRTAAGADRGISFAPTLPTDVERCMKVKVGQAVTFTTSSFGTHPLIPSGGDTPTPIRAQRFTGTVEAFLFPSVGVFGYKCDAHPTMLGAIQVVP